MRRSELFVFFGLALVLAGCSTEPESIAVATQEGGLPPEAIVAVQAASSKEPAFQSPTVGWLEAGEQIAVTVVNDGECPVTLTSLDLVDSDRLSLEVVATGGAECGTGDRSRTAHILNTPTGVDYSGGVTLDYMGTEVALPPVFNPAVTASR